MPAFQGTRYTRNVALRSCSTNAPINIESWEFRGMIRDSRNDPEQLITLTSANGGFNIIDAVNGRLQFTLSPAQTIILPVGRMMMDVERTDHIDGPVWLFELTFQSKTPITRDFP
jgi:hypothetical protein